MERTKLILITGLPASGKTTLAKKLEKKLGNFFRVDIDELKKQLYKTYHQINGQYPEKTEKNMNAIRQIALNDGIKMAVSLLCRNCNVIVEYCWDEKSGTLLKDAINQMSSQPEIIIIHLKCSREIAYNRYLNRIQKNSTLDTLQNNMENAWSFDEYVKHIPEGCETWIYK